MTDVFDNATSITIGSKEVASIEIDGGSIWESEPVPSEFSVTLDCTEMVGNVHTPLKNEEFSLDGVSVTSDGNAQIITTLSEGTHTIEWVKQSLSTKTFNVDATHTSILFEW